MKDCEFNVEMYYDTDRCDKCSKKKDCEKRKKLIKNFNDYMTDEVLKWGD